MRDAALPRSNWTIQLVVAGALLAITAGYLFLAFGYSFGSWSNPRAGFLPRIAGVLGTGLALINLVSTLLRRPADCDLGEMPLRALGVAAVLAAYPVGLSFGGYLASTAIVTFLLVKLFGARTWLMPVVVAAATSGGTYLLFARVLELRIP
ncbi:Tripartite tricarboxylate transporter TctB family protein [Devosia enhydra]|uniref:Tripartite tricarboxylate transporter TctB family protein n=1 Tax=Devosia enhydra TaxID=665118 RepID=A0A1K2I0Q3_9HYPH|nr:tripartite tricarboxylate transporter TctB family protein [Devosia enhydra]SFZ85950.1 Tripartite tricarboxylate transporter TctB family protein [Devosia enhydra]